MKSILRYFIILTTLVIFIYLIIYPDAMISLGWLDYIGSLLFVLVGMDIMLIMAIEIAWAKTSISATERWKQWRKEHPNAI